MVSRLHSRDRVCQAPISGWWIYHGINEQLCSTGAALLAPANPSTKVFPSKAIERCSMHAMPPMHGSLRGGAPLGCASPSSCSCRSFALFSALLVMIIGPGAGCPLFFTNSAYFLERV
eukprot:366426-Chlamydomonas_euryale.AAC.29